MTSPLIMWENAVPNDLKDPVLICSLDGWIDAGYGAQAAMGSLKQQIRTHRLVAFDTDPLIDFRARRPVMRLVNGINTELQWPRLQMRHGKDAIGADILVLTGPEPDFRWRGFTEAVMELVDVLEVRMCVNLGAFPAPVPHTRPVTLGSTATTDDLAQRIGFVESAFEIPAGVSASIERAFAERDKPAVGIWARVPHYVSQMLYPEASAAILDGLARVTGLVVETEELHRNARVVSAQIDALVENNPEHIEMVRQLEAQVDSEAAPKMTMVSDGTPLPTGDELAAELEKYLRDQ